MVSSTANALIRMGGWAYIPNFATSTALQVLYRVYTVVTGRPPPAAGTPAHVRNYRYTYAVVVLGYLAYNLVEASRLMPPNYYEILGVYPDADEGRLKAGFRAFARRYHPDKIGPEGEALFIGVRDAYEALKNPVTRFAYDRFGPEALTWTKCSTVLEYLYQGLTRSVGFHLVSGAVLLALSAVGAPSPASFWRYLFFFALMGSELALILGPSIISPGPTSLSSSPTTSQQPPSIHSNFLTLLFPRRVVYQHILFLHQLFLFLSVAVSKVAPVLFPPSIDEIEGAGVDTKTLDTIVNGLEQGSKALLLELNHMLQTQLHAVHSDPTRDDGTRFGAMRAFPEDQINPQTMETIVNGMTAVALEGRLRQAADGPGPLKSVWESAVARVRNAVAINARPTASRKVSRRTEWWERRRPSQADTRVDIDLTADPAEPRLPSPISASNSQEDVPRKLPERSRLPSPRPSPFPRTPAPYRRESHLRERSSSF